MLLFFVALLLFGLPLSMLNQNRFRYSEDEQIIDEVVRWWLYDIIYNQYLLALGEFVTLDAYTERDVPDKDFVVFVFIAATFFTQITMLNMLIAIMGDVFD